MASIEAQPAGVRHPVLPDIGKARMAKADVRIPDITNADIGAAIQRAVLTVWTSNKEAARDLDVDDAEFGKWLSGNRRAQFDKLLAWHPLRKPLGLEIMRLVGARVLIRAEFDE